MRRYLIALPLLLTLVVACGPVVAGIQFPPHTACATPLQVRDTDLIDCTGQVVVLRGVSQPSALNFIGPWKAGQRPATGPNQPLNAASMAAMASWNMNVLRVPVSAYIEATNPTVYLGQLDTIVTNAQIDGYAAVVFALFDDPQSGSPYKAANQWHPQDAAFLTTLVMRYGTNPLVMYDPLNEPRISGWSAWSSVMNQAIAIIRSHGSTQPVVLEPTEMPGNSGPFCTLNGVAVKDGFSNLPKTLMPVDSETIYSLHTYNGVINDNPAAWPCAMGFAEGTHPEYIGEWGVLPHALSPHECTNLTSSNANSKTNGFMNWLLTGNAGHAISWTAWDFHQGNLIQDNFTSFTPTTFATGTWKCDDGSTAAKLAGMGVDVKNWLLTH